MFARVCAARVPCLFVLVVIVLALPLACSGSSRNADAPKGKASASVASVAVAPPPPDPCEVAAGLRTKVKPFLDEGRLHRTVRLIEKANRLCPKSAPETWAALVATLAELGRYAEARALAAQIESAPNAPDDAKQAATAAKALCDQRDKVFPDTDEAKKEMRRLYFEAFDAEQNTDAASQKVAKEKYLAAWEAWHPQGQALVEAGFAAKRLGEFAEAQRLFDRAIEDAMKAQRKGSLGLKTWTPSGRGLLSGNNAEDTKVTLDVTNGFGGDGHAFAWSRDGRMFAVAHGEALSIFDKTWRLKFRLHGHAGRVASVSFAPDGKTLAFAPTDGTIRLWDIATGRQIQALYGHTDPVVSVAYSPNGKTLVSMESGNNAVKIWDIVTGKATQTLSGQHAVRIGRYGHTLAPAFSPDGKTLAFVSDSEIVELWDAPTGKTRKIPGNYGGQRVDFNYSFSPDSKTLALHLYTGSVHLWDVTTARPLRTVKVGQFGVNAISYAADGKILSSISYNIDIWNIATGKLIRTLEGHEGVIRSFAYSPDAKTFASASVDGTVKVWDVATGTEVRTFKAREYDARDGWLRDFSTLVAYSPDSKTLALRSSTTTSKTTRDEAIHLWDVTTGKTVQTFQQLPWSILSLAYSPDGKTLASGSRDHSVRLWDVSTGKPLRTLDKHESAVSSVAFSPDGKTIASGSHDGTVRLWDVATGNEVRTLLKRETSIKAVAYSPDARLLAFGSQGKIGIWDLASGKELRTLRGDVTSVAFSPDSKTLALAYALGAPILLDISSGNVQKSFGRPNGAVNSVAFSPDGQMIASGADDYTVKLWDVTSDKLLRSLGQDDAPPNSLAFEAPPNSLAFSPNGKMIASGAYDHTVKLWDVALGAERRTLREPIGKVNSVVFSPESKTLASGTDEGFILIHRVEDGALLAMMAFVSGKNAYYHFVPTGHIDIQGADACAARIYPSCRIGTLAWPFDVCEERFLVPDLLAKVQASDTSYLEPEDAPKRMNCPDAP